MNVCHSTVNGLDRMYQQLQDLYSTLDSTLHKYAISSCRRIDVKSDVVKECKDLLRHMSTMPEVKLTYDKYGIATILGTTIMVESNISNKHFIISRYGQIEIPTLVIA